MSTSDSAPDRAHRPDTLLVTLTGRERPGVTSAVFATLGRAGVEVVDLEQIVLRRRLILGLLVTAPDDVQSLRQDLQATADDLSMTLEVEPGSGDTSQPSHGRAHVTVLGTPLTAAAMAAVAGRIADAGANIDRIERMARYPVTALDLHVSGAAPDALRAELAAEAARQGIDVAVQPADLLRRGMRLIVMDVDSTLIQGEVIEMIAAHAGCEAEVAEVTERAMRGEPRELAVFEPGDDGRTILGRVAAKGLADELHDRGYLVIDGVDGKAHYVALNARDELANYPTGAVVEVRGSNEVRAADKNIAALASDGLYRADHPLAIEQGRAKPGRDPQEVVAAHVRRLEALRRAGIVERVADGLWKVPDDLAERGRQNDAQRLGGVAVELKSHLPIERQARVIGATWLDQQLIGGGKGLGDLGFGGETKEALQQRADFLAEQGLAERRGQRVILARNLLATLRDRDVIRAAKDIATETGLEHRLAADGQRVTGIYRRSLMLASGRFAMLDDGMGFSLVPWTPVIEQRLGMLISGQVHGGTLSWQIRRQQGLSVT